MGASLIAACRRCCIFFCPNFTSGDKRKFLVVMSGNISLDDSGQIRVLPADKYEEAEKLGTECNQFLSKITEFNTLVNNVVDAVDAQAKIIETEKLKAIGYRNKLDGEEEAKAQKVSELNSIIHERKAEHERLTAQYESLLKVEAEQKTLIDKLSNNEI